MENKTNTHIKNQTVVSIEPGKLDLYITREFDAPRELVFRAFTESDLYARWLGPRRLGTRFDLFEPRDGGRWKFVNFEPDGTTYEFHGVYHEVTAPERIIGTFEFDGLPEKGHVVLETTRFEALPNGRTRLTSQDIFQSVADRDGMVQSGMEEGTRESYERLDELLETLR